MATVEKVPLLGCKPVLRVIDAGRVIYKEHTRSSFQHAMVGLIEGYGLGYGRGMGDNIEVLPGLPDLMGSCIAGITCSEEGSHLSLPPLQKGLGLAIWE